MRELSRWTFWSRFLTATWRGCSQLLTLIQLMEHKLLVSSIDQSSFFMPILLPDLSPEEVAQHRAGPDSAITPLTILFPCDLVPIGLFCSLVSSLLSAATPPQLRLKASPSDRALMECVASNCINFSPYPDNAGSVVLINTLRPPGAPPQCSIEGGPSPSLPHTEGQGACLYSHRHSCPAL